MTLYTYLSTLLRHNPWGFGLLFGFAAIALLAHLMDLWVRNLAPADHHSEAPLPILLKFALMWVFILCAATLVVL